MKNNHLYFSIFFLIILLLGCHFKSVPGPATSVHGTITDYTTGLPLANQKLIIKQTIDDGDWLSGIIMPTASHSYSYKYYDTITTKADGTYKYDFKPDDSGSSVLHLFLSNNYVDKKYTYQYSSDSETDLVLGIDNKTDYALQKVINLNLHLMNGSAQNATNVSCYLSACCFTINSFGVFNLKAAKLDTVLHAKIPTKSVVTFQSIFYTVAANTYTGTYKFNSGSRDTTVTVTNP